MEFRDEVPPGARARCLALDTYVPSALQRKVFRRHGLADSHPAAEIAILSAVNG